ncbi:MAG TPA: peptidoglycan-binding domain-containing protein [Candidatus Paceibacterota bacterium]|nr:peptidoglycan-binding domain-containing protein [Candidatus Paceibacterota bacterium]
MKKIVRVAVSVVMMGAVSGFARAAINSPLTLGSRGAQVTELQQTLAGLGFYNGPITGYFGSLTKAAVVQFQLANGINPAAGYFGAISRAKLNQSAQGGKGGSKSAPPAAAIAACSGKAVGDACQFLDKGAQSSGTCDDKPGVLACRKGQGGDVGQSSGQNVGGQSTGSQTSSTGQNQYNISQAISDNAQLNTMAFDGLGFLTGNTCSDSFLPPGKVADFFGFQYLRDVTQAGKGHSTDFVTNAANNVLSVLTADQKTKMLTLAKAQESLVNQFAYSRFPLMVAFRRQLTGNIPSGSTGLSKSAVMSYSSDLYALDAQISIQRAKLYADVVNSLTASQKTFLDAMMKGGFYSWAALPDQLDKSSMTHDENVLMMTYAGDILSWYGGSVEADTYFCPERHADYFGGFYIKDAPAIGNAGYTIDESITGDQGAAFLSALDSTQRSTVTSVIDSQRTDITSIVDKRRAISNLLRVALTGGSVDEASVMSLARQYGALDGEISYYYATAFSSVGKSLSTAQTQTLQKLRGLDNYVCPATQAFLYSEKITMPNATSTDFLFE